MAGVNGAHGYNYGYNYSNVKNTHARGSEKTNGKVVYDDSPDVKKDKALAKSHGLDYELIKKGNLYEAQEKRDQSGDSKITFNPSKNEDYDKAIAEWNKFKEIKASSEETKSESVNSNNKSETYKPDMDKIRQMKADLRGNLGAFKQMVFSEAKTQGNHAHSALRDILKGIEGMSQEDAAKAVADDGDWGVDATANRILDFAKALSGGDPAKIETLRDAVNKGFAAAGKLWGGDLPEISHKTLAKVMEGFDEWEKTGSADNIGTKTATNSIF